MKLLQISLLLLISSASAALAVPFPGDYIGTLTIQKRVQPGNLMTSQTLAAVASVAVDGVITVLTNTPEPLLVTLSSPETTDEPIVSGDQVGAFRALPFIQYGDENQSQTARPIKFDYAIGKQKAQSSNTGDTFHLSYWRSQTLDRNLVPVAPGPRSVSTAVPQEKLQTLVTSFSFTFRKHVFPIPKPLP